MDGSPRVPHATPAAPAAPAAPPRDRDDAGGLLARGEIVHDTYEVLAPLGAGGMAQVYDAIDRTLNRRVALKIARRIPGLPTLRDEARALASVRHPGVVGVYAAGIHRGVDFIAMERVFGATLATHMQQRFARGARYKLREALDILIGVAEPLAAVHAAGIAHRDVKPENVMLAPGGRVVLMDFGVFLPEVAFRSGGYAAGTPVYMAPEALMNAVAPGAGERVDLFALGALAFELLSGELPFGADGVEEILERELKGPLPRLASRRPDVPEALDTLVAEMLAREPAERPESAESVLWQLRSMRARLGAEANEPATPFRVLVVDDDAGLLAALRGLVVDAAPGARVATARDGIAAVESVRAHPPDLMLLDLDLPGMSGMEVCMAMRGEGLAPGCRIVAVSGRAQVRDAEALVGLGVERVVSKSVDLERALVPLVRDARARHAEAEAQRRGSQATPGARRSTPR